MNPILEALMRLIDGGPHLPDPAHQSLLETIIGREKAAPQPYRSLDPQMAEWLQDRFPSGLPEGADFEATKRRLNAAAAIEKLRRSGLLK